MMKKLTIFDVPELDNGQLVRVVNALRTKVNRTLRKKELTKNSLNSLRRLLQKHLLSLIHMY